jgi:HK97 family phage prohead protease/HK97 family phage major capsid protein
MIRLTNQELTLDAAAPGELPRRTLAGTALPYNVVAQVMGGEKVLFRPGSLTASKRPKMYLSHDSSKPIGVVTSMVDTESAMLYEAKISATALGTESLQLALDGVLDAVSVGVVPTEFSYDEAGVMIVTAAEWQELSLVPFGAFSGATVDRVAASIHQNDEPVVLNEINDQPKEVEQMSEVVEAPTVIEAASMPIYAQPKSVKMPSAAEWISSALVGGSEFSQMQANIRAAAPNVTTSDSVGLLPEILVQPVYNNFKGLRPTIDAIGPRSIPQAGFTFRLPYVSTHNTVATQSAENAALQASTYVVSSYDVTKVTYGGYVNVSEQDIDFSSPEVIGLLLDDMARIYANATDNAVADALLAAVTQSAVLTDPTSAAEWVSDIYDASVTILNNSNGNLPTHLFLSPNMFGYLGKLVDTAGRPLFPQIGPMNAFGTMAPGMANGAPTAFGLTVVVDRNFAADTVIVADPSGYFVGEQQKGAISIDVPSTMSRTIAFRGYLSQQMVDATKFVKLT